MGSRGPARDPLGELMGRPELWGLGEELECLSQACTLWKVSQWSPASPGRVGSGRTATVTSWVCDLSRVKWMSSVDRNLVHPHPFRELGAQPLRSHLGLTRRDAVLWFRHLPGPVMPLPCSVILDLTASRCWRTESAFYQLPSELLVDCGFLSSSRTHPRTPISLMGALCVFLPLCLHVLLISFCSKNFPVFPFPLPVPHLETTSWCFTAPRADLISSGRPAWGRPPGRQKSQTILDNPPLWYFSFPNHSYDLAIVFSFQGNGEVFKKCLYLLHFAGP